MKRYAFVAAVFLAAAVMGGCGAQGGTMDQNGEGETSQEKPTEQKLSYDATVDNVEWLSYVTGPQAATDTLEGWQVGGTDLGFPCYDKTSGNMYVAFGDTFQNAASQTGLWRSNVLGVTKDFTLSDGLTFDSFIGNGVIAQSIVEGQHIDMFEMTKIPTGGIEVNGTLYYFYFSKYSWNVAAAYSMNYGGCVKSTDGGQTWQRVHDLSWLDPSLPERKGEIERLANQDIDMTDADHGITMENHAGYSFTQVFPIDGKDGYVYLLGEGGYRSGGIRLARVTYANFEHFDEYEYFNGTDANGAPVWGKGLAGLQACEANRGSYIVSDKCSEQSAMYDPYLDQWIVVYLKDNGDGIVYRAADEIWGTYSEPRVLVPYNYPFENGVNSIYAGIVHEKWTEENGKVFYLVISQWKPIYNSSVMKITLK